MSTDELKQAKARHEAARAREKATAEKLAEAGGEFTRQLTAARLELQKPVQAAHAEHAAAEEELRKATEAYKTAQAEHLAEL